MVCLSVCHDMGVAKGDHGDQFPLSYTEKNEKRNKEINTGNSISEFRHKISIEHTPRVTNPREKWLPEY